VYRLAPQPAPSGAAESAAHSLAVADLDDPVSALVLLRLAGAVELDQMRPTELLLAELEPASRNCEVGIALRYLAAILRPKPLAYL
jgi:hypothetical protein